MLHTAAYICHALPAEQPTTILPDSLGHITQRPAKKSLVTSPVCTVANVRKLNHAHKVCCQMQGKLSLSDTHRHMRTHAVGMQAQGCKAPVAGSIVIYLIAVQQQWQHHQLGQTSRLQCVTCSRRHCLGAVPCCADGGCNLSRTRNSCVKVNVRLSHGQTHCDRHHAGNL